MDREYISVTDESDNDWNTSDLLPRQGPSLPTCKSELVPALWALARPNRKRATLPHHFLPPEVTIYRSSDRLLDRLQAVTSLGKGQNRMFYAIDRHLVLKLTTHEAVTGF